MTRAITLALCLVLMSATAHAERISVQADTMQKQGSTYELTGNVRIKRAERTVSADRAVYDESTGVVQAEGGVILNGPGFEVEAASGRMDMNANTGVLYNSTMKLIDESGAEGFHITSSEALIMDKGHYVLRDAAATTCTGIPAAWCIKGHDIDVIVGERIEAWHTTFRVRDVPVFYVPYVWAPIVQERRSGLLPPTIGYRSETGMYYEQPYFWAISENRDATFSLIYHTRRAFAQQIEYRYVEGPRTAGSFDVLHLRDSELSMDYQRFRLAHVQSSEDYTFKMSGDYITYRDFFRRYEDTTAKSSVRFLESSASLHHAFAGGSRLYAVARYIEDLRDDAAQQDVVQRAPEIGFYMAPSEAGPFTIGGRATAVSFYREEGDEAERVSAEMSAAHSMGAVPNLSQKASAEGYRYWIEGPGASGEPTESSAVYEYQARAGLSARKYLTSRVLHKFEPSITYAITEVRGDIPERFDEAESISDASTVTVELMNRLSDSGGEFMKARLLQPLDLKRDTQRYDPLQLDVSYSGLSNSGVYFATKLSYDHYVRNLSSANSTISWFISPLGMSATQNYDRASIVETYGLALTLTQGAAWEHGASLTYDRADERGIEEVSLGTLYKAQCWQTKLSAIAKEDDEYSFEIKLGLVGLGQ